MMLLGYSRLLQSQGCNKILDISLKHLYLRITNNYFGVQGVLHKLPPTRFFATSFSFQTSEIQASGSMKRQAEIGFKTGGENYDANRPSYTDEAVSLISADILSSLKPGVKYDVLELGAGTGKLTETLIKKLPNSIKYLASEPSENFLEVLKSKNLKVDVAKATADNIPLDDQSVSNIVCAQCFHWFAEKENLKSIRRVLLPGGKLILIWNMIQFDKELMTVFYEQRKEIVEKIKGSLKHLVNSMEWKQDINESPDFKLDWYKSLPGINFQEGLEDILAYLTTGSAYNGLPVEERNAYVDQLRQVLKNWPGLDLENITIPFTTEVYVYQAK